MKIIKLLYVSIAFPPKWDSEGLQVAKYFKYLKRNDKLSISVVTSKNPTLNMPIDETLKEYSDGYQQLIEIPIFENKYINYAIRNIYPQALQKPDSKFSFIWGWKKVVKQLKKSPDIIYSRSFPLSSAIMALKLKKYYNVPWIFHMSDPWVDNHIDKRHPEVMAWNKDMELTCFEEADRVTVTSLETQAFYQKKYPQLSEKIMVHYNVYDRETFLANPYKIEGKLTFVCTGGLTVNRSPVPL
ncbi:MAG: hypothetical protein D3917_06435, partial [Candidatus Electrothrix sp. AX5]|nr:hypothetical protein [Candidatus Electrothrix sp. AX5]